MADATVVGYLPADKSDFKSEFTALDAALWRIKFDVETLGVTSHAQVRRRSAFASSFAFTPALPDTVTSNAMCLCCSFCAQEEDLEEVEVDDAIEAYETNVSSKRALEGIETAAATGRIGQIAPAAARDARMLIPKRAQDVKPLTLCAHVYTPRLTAPETGLGKRKEPTGEAHRELVLYWRSDSQIYQ